MKSSLRIVGLLAVSVAVVVSALAIGCQDKSGSSSGSSSGDEPIVWYGMMSHPYKTEVRKGVDQSEKDNNVAIRKFLGSAWTQENENTNITALSTQNHKAFSIYPGDPVSANGLFQKLKDHGQIVVAYGAEPDLPTPAAFTVATNIRGAAERAAKELIKMMGDKGNILNVLETITDINTKKRDDGINYIVGKHPNVKIIQTISDVPEEAQAIDQIRRALAARADEIDGIITTGYNPTVAAANVLTDWHKDPSHKRIRFIGIDTDKTVLEAIRNGSIDATISQNPFGHGYVSTTILAMMLKGCKPVKDYQFIDAGIVVVTKANVDTYRQEVQKITDGIIAELKDGKTYLAPPAAAGAATTQPAK
jgi:ribose transport system substrate-binding protein